VTAPVLAALWLADPPNPPPAGLSWGQSIAALPEQINDFFSRLVGDQPVDVMPFLPAPTIPDCGAEAVIAAYKARLQAQQRAQTFFDLWHERWQISGDIIRNDAGIFLVNAVKFASNWLSASTSIVGGFEDYIARVARQSSSNMARLETEVIEVGLVAAEEIAEFDRLIFIAQTTEKQVRNFFAGLSGVTGSVVGTGSAIANGGLASGMDVMDKLLTIGSWTGRDDFLEFASLASGAAADITQIFSSVTLMIEISGRVAPQFSDLLGKIGDGLSLVKSGLDGISTAIRQNRQSRPSRRIPAATMTPQALALSIRTTNSRSAPGKTASSAPARRCHTRCVLKTWPPRARPRKS
jgi:hypothetical protein